MRNSEPDVLTQALAEPSRRAILESLRFGRKTVSELVLETQRKQPNISNHLAKMREQGLVRAERIGRQVYYTVATPFAEVFLRLQEFTENPLPTLHADRLKSTQEHPEEWMDPSHSGSRHSAQAQEAILLSQPFLEWRAAYLQSVMEGQEEQATKLINAMLVAGVGMESIYVEVFQWTLNHIGDLYLQGLTDEAHEHLASAITERMMAKVSQFYAPMGRGTHRAVCGCVAGNWHTLGLRMLSDGLRGQGWETLFLGANVPTESFHRMVASVQPDMVLISCVLEEQWQETKVLVSKLHADRQAMSGLHYQIVVGGRYILDNPTILWNTHIDFYANDLHHFLDEVHKRF